MKDCLDNILAPLYKVQGNYSNNNHNRTDREAIVPPFSAWEYKEQYHKELFIKAYNWVRELNKYADSEANATLIFIPTSTRSDITPTGKGSVIRDFLEARGICSLHRKLGGPNSHYADEYYWYPTNAKLFYEECKEYGVNQYIKKSDGAEMLDEDIMVPLVNTWHLPTTVEFGEYYDNPGLDEELFKAYLFTVFVKTHPEYQLFEALAKDIPSKYENQYKMNFKKKRGKYCLSFRMYNPFCSLPSLKNKDHHKEQYAEYRELKYKGYYEYDIVSSVARINYFKKTGNPDKLDFSYDFYYETYKRYVEKMREEEYMVPLVNTCDFRSSGLRDRVKGYCNPGAFDETKKKFSYNVIRNIDLKRRDMTEDGYWVPNTAELYEYRKSLEILYDAIIEVIGKLDNGIFYDESNIMLLIMKKLTDEGYDVIYCYDAVYVNSPDIDFQSLFNWAIDVYFSEIVWNCDYSSLYMRDDDEEKREEEYMVPLVNTCQNNVILAQNVPLC